ncbi:hypothetical protein HYQ44_007123 [Verticillium longisporum]|nr:hypothetical protein HYQ44_007123 [Verticillium longisporum]
MCIVLLTTAHPSYALIVIDNRDEFILRPTSRPHWWSHPAGPTVLSPRDLQRAEKGTWLGLTSTGALAVLTNYREDGPPDAAHPIHAQRSRGGMVTAWLGADPREPTAETVQKLVADGGVRGRGKGEWDTDDKMAAEQLQRPDATPGENGIGFDTGMYGTQRQSVILVDWDGNVVFKERALWDSNGNPIPKGEGDVVFKYKIDGQNRRAFEEYEGWIRQKHDENAMIKGYSFQ